MECPPNLRGNPFNSNPNVAVTDNDAEAGSSKAITEKSTAISEQLTESDVETGSESDGEDSEEEETVADDENDENAENANGNGAAGTSNQNHYIQVIIHDGNLVNVNNGHIQSDQMQRARANGLRYMVGVVNGEGKSMEWSHCDPKLITNYDFELQVRLKCYSVISKNGMICLQLALVCCEGQNRGKSRRRHRLVNDLRLEK